MVHQAVTPPRTTLLHLLRITLAVEAEAITRQVAVAPTVEAAVEDTAEVTVNLSKEAIARKRAVNAGRPFSVLLERLLCDG